MNDEELERMLEQLRQPKSEIKSEVRKNSGVADFQKVIPLTRIRLTVKRFDNLSRKQKPLLPPEYLLDVNAALDAYVRFVKQQTLPTERSNERFVVAPKSALPSWLQQPIILQQHLSPEQFSSANGFTLLQCEDHPFALLICAIEKLQLEWSGIIQKSDPTGRKAAEMPSASDLWTLFSLSVELIEESTTLSTLGEYSMLKPPAIPKTTEKLDAAHSARRRAELEEDLRQMKITADEYHKALARLESEEKVQAIVDHVSDYI